METTPAEGEGDRDLHRLPPEDLPQRSERNRLHPAARIPTPRVSGDEPQHRAVVSQIVRDGNELLLLHTAIDETAQHAEEAALALRAVAARIAESEDRIARLEMFVDRVHELDSKLYALIKAEFGWSDL